MDHLPLFNQPEQKQSNAVELTVSQLSQNLKRLIEEKFDFIRLKGEISGFKQHTSGHCYFSLKDSDAVLNAVMWKGVAGKLTFKPYDGMEIIATGKITTYAGRSYYQMMVERMEPAGSGALMAILEERKKKLAAEGLFAGDRKKPLPFLPDVIGIITSPTGAVIRDILHRLNDRFPRHVLLYPVAVQGQGAAEQVATAIHWFNRKMPADFPKPDVLIVARGGGSIEDLWAFNEEIVVRATAESLIPIISAVGHETDTTLIDYASDHRSPTPTGAAERAVPVRSELLAHLGRLDSRQIQGWNRCYETLSYRFTTGIKGLQTIEQKIGQLEQRLDMAILSLNSALQKSVIPASQQLHRLVVLFDKSLPDYIRGKDQALQTTGQRLEQGFTQLTRLKQQALHTMHTQIDDKMKRLAQGFTRYLENQNHTLTTYSKILDSLSYKRTLERGYTVFKQDGKIISSAKDVNKKMDSVIEFSDGNHVFVA